MPMELQNQILQTEQESHKTKQTASFPSSPAHEFSFNNISLHSTPATSSAIDLTPADDIFFHGHLLPLHHHHHLHSLPISPRSSVDASALPIPIRDLISDQPNHTTSNSCICIRCDHNRNRGHSFNSYEYYSTRPHLNNDVNPKPASNPTRRTKAKSFSLFGTARRQKEAEDNGVNRKKTGFDVMPHFLRKYVKMFSNRKTEDLRFRGKFSPPATSPTNSGVIISGTKRVNTPHSNNNDSTMEELQAAIQAAIAHCKDSIAGPPHKLQT